MEGGGWRRHSLGCRWKVCGMKSAMQRLESKDDDMLQLPANSTGNCYLLIALPHHEHPEWKIEELHPQLLPLF
jgi:hypothetical protein